MSTYLSRAFVDKKISWLPFVPDRWEVPKGNYFQLELKMCQVTTFKYSFQWHDDRGPQPKIAAPVDQPSKILHLDTSVNDISVLDFDAMMPFRNLRSLDASLNRIESIPGLEVCEKLRYLNLSHNFLQRIQGLRQCKHLLELHLSMNQVVRIDNIPRLDALTIVYLDHNQLESLTGIQSLISLQELHVQKNRLKSILPTTACLNLQLINASDNRIFDLRETSEALHVLKKMEHLLLLNNPILSHENYRRTMVESTTICYLDGQNVRPHKVDRDASFKQKIFTISDVARKAHMEKLESEREKMKEDVRLLQLRIIDRQEEFKEYEAKVRKEMDTCIRHLDQLPDNFPKVKVLKPGAIEFIDEDKLPMNASLPTENEDGVPRHTHKLPRPDYRNVKSTDEVLRLAFNELSHGKGRQSQSD